MVYCIPFSVYSLYVKKNSIDFGKIFTSETLMEFAASAILWYTAFTVYVWGSEYTLVSHTGLLSNLGGIFIVMVNIILSISVHKLEIVGTVIVILSCIICVSDKYSTKTNGQTNIIFGDILSLASSPPSALFYIVNARLLKKLPPIVIFHVNSIIQLVMNICIFTFFNGTDKFLSFDPLHGVFGWASDTYLLHSLIFIGIFAGMLGSGGYIFALKFFPPHIVGSIFLLEPILVQILGCLLNQDIANLQSIKTINSS